MKTALTLLLLCGLAAAQTITLDGVEMDRAAQSAFENAQRAHAGKLAKIAEEAAAAVKFLEASKDGTDDVAIDAAIATVRSAAERRWKTLAGVRVTAADVKDGILAEEAARHQRTVERMESLVEQLAEDAPERDATEAALAVEQQRLDEAEAALAAFRAERDARER